MLKTPAQQHAGNVDSQRVVVPSSPRCTKEQLPIKSNLALVTQQPDRN